MVVSFSNVLDPAVTVVSLVLRSIENILSWTPTIATTFVAYNKYGIMRRMISWATQKLTCTLSNIKKNCFSKEN